MNRNFDTDNFERLLKEKADEFKMYPSKRVWYSIYNNIHPGKRWPSIATSIGLIGVLLLIGFLNTNYQDGSINFTPDKQPVLFNPGQVNFYDPFLNPLINSFPKQKNSTKTTAYLSIPGQPAFLLSTSITDPILIPASAIANRYQTTNKIEGADKYPVALKPAESIIPPAFSVTAFLPLLTLATENKFVAKQKFTPEFKTSANQFNQAKPVTLNLPLLSEMSLMGNDFFKLAKQPSKIDEANKLFLTTDKDWIENYALYNRPAPKKWAGKLSRQLYITPSIVYRDLSNVMVTNTADVNKIVTQKPSAGIEIGSAITYAIVKGLKLKAGLQLNTTRYNTEAYENAHPVSSFITFMPDGGMPAYQEARTTPFSNYFGISPVKLHNETFQISLPVGADLKLAGEQNLQWWVGATIQPTYIIGGKSYLLSSDNKYFIKATDLINKWNLNAGFETYLSYQVNGYTIQFGPQFRKQLFTTNSNQYFLHERLNNYGIKVGISKLIK